MNPSELLYAPSHEWVYVSEQNGQKVGTVGISKFAIEQLNDLVYMDLPDPGKVLNAGDEFGEVESVKAVSPLYSPVSGEIIDVNKELPSHLERLSEDPYQQGWIIKVRITDDASLGSLMGYEAYEKQCAEQG